MLSISGRGNDVYGKAAGIFTDFMRSKGFDGVIYIEGGDHPDHNNPVSYVFYNTEKVGTYESWKQQPGAVDTAGKTPREIFEEIVGGVENGDSIGRQSAALIKRGIDNLSNRSALADSNFESGFNRNTDELTFGLQELINNDKVNLSHALISAAGPVGTLGLSDGFIRAYGNEILTILRHNPNTPVKTLVQKGIDRQERITQENRQQLIDFGAALTDRQGNLYMYVSGDYAVVVVREEGSREVYKATGDITRSRVTNGDKIYIVTENIESDILPLDTLEQTKTKIAARDVNYSFSAVEVNNVKKEDFGNESPITVLQKEPFLPDQLIQVLKQTPELQKLFEADAQVWEGHTIEEHTLMVMQQFEKYFAGKWDSQHLSKEDFRIALALHDIGKSLGHRTEQHANTRTVAARVLGELGYDERKIDVITGLVGQDYIGRFLQGRTGTQETAKLIAKDARSLDIPIGEYYDLLNTYYLCDASSYTEDAGGPRSLDGLFSFHHNVDENHHSIGYSERTGKQIAELNAEIKRMQPLEATFSSLEEGKPLDRQLTDLLNSKEYLETLQRFDGKDRETVMGYTIEYFIFHPDGFGFPEFMAKLQSMENISNAASLKSEEVTSLFVDSIARRLQIDDASSIPAMRKIFDYYVDRTDKNGYYFHSFNGVFKEKVLREGLSPKERTWDEKDLDKISSIGAKHGVGMLLGWRNINATGNLFFAASTDNIYRYAVASPEWFAQFTSEGFHIPNAKVNKQAYYRRDYETARGNIDRMLDKMQSASEADVAAKRAYPNITNEERLEILTFFEKYWSELAGQNSTPTVALIRRQALGYMHDDFDHYQTLLARNDETVDIVDVLDFIRGYDGRSADMRTQKTISPQDFILVDLPDYNSVFPLVK